ncbi:MAG TPA: hypothetical protein ENG96_05480 [Gammaproteobacteria bacterium]|nr:hypothetical protein [Gammaproteobacteria bacterium]
MTASFGAVSAPITQTITPPAVTTVAPGDVLGPFAIAYTNNTSALYQFYLQEYVIGSNGNVRWWPPSGKWLLGDATRNVNKRFRARSWFKNGLYTFGILLTDTDGNIIDDDSFDFTVDTASAP